MLVVIIINDDDYILNNLNNASIELEQLEVMNQPLLMLD